jgi:hypothetical protein
MVQATEYLSGYRTGLKSLKEPITRLDHITYHLEYHLVRTASLMDWSLQLVNEVFDLGVPERECSFRTVADNKHVKSTPVRKKLQNLESLLKPYREHRNVVIHQEGFRDSALDRIGPYYILQKSTEPADEFLKHWFQLSKTHTDRYIHQKKRKLTDFNDQALAKVHQICESLIPYFERRYRAMREDR